MTDLTTLDNLKTALDITPSAEDEAWLQAELSAVSNFVQQYLGRDLIAGTDHTQEVELPKHKVLTVQFPIAQLKTVEIDGVDKPLTDYRVRKPAGVILSKARHAGCLTGGELMVITYDSADDPQLALIERAVIDVTRDRYRAKNTNTLQGTVATASGSLKTQVVFGVASHTYETQSDLIKAASSGSASGDAAAALFGNWVGFLDQLRDFSRDVDRSHL